MEVIHYLKSPFLVSKIQRFFGVKLLDEPAERHKEYKYEITNKFWYYLFVFATSLGDEVFYSSFIPFWFWNIDGAVGRRVVLVWSIVMYVGQGIKDVIRWERPGPPVVKLQSKWAMEYGMPSTHAMVGIAIPFSILLYTMDRYQYNFSLGLIMAISLCTMICISRIYLGMHTVLDIIVGLLLAIQLMIPLIPLVDKLDNSLLTNPTAPFLVLVISILMIVYYPNSGKWTPTRGDTTMIVSVCVGIQIGAWLNYQTGNMTPSELHPPYTIIWSINTMLGCAILRTILGFLGVLLTHIVAKKYSYSLLCALLRRDVDDMKRIENSLQNKHKNFVELSCKYLTCALIGFNTLYLFPHMFRLIRIERPTFYTEI